jgi:hypothetical protein
VTERVLYLLTCGPLLLTLGAWVKLYWARQRQWPDAFALLALGIVSANAAFAAGTFLYYQFRPVPSWVPPWKDPQILTLGLLSVLGPIGMILGVVAGVLFGAPKWLICIVEIGSLLLFVIGDLAGVAV